MLSTLHTNDAPSTITRLVDMGVEAFNVASAVNLVVAQRLVRRICKDCKAPATYTAEEIASLGTNLEHVKFMKGQGCETCGGQRVQGAAGPVRGHGAHARSCAGSFCVAARWRKSAIRRYVDGMLTLRMDGLKKVERGVTTLEEVVKETAG